jgi:glycerol-3-phosphate acyltransferase PlsY
MRFGLDWYVDGSIIMFAAIIAFGIIYKHKANIGRLMAGTESKVGAKATTLAKTEASTAKVN